MASSAGIAGDEDEMTDGSFGPTEAKVLAGGFAVAAVVTAVPFTRFIFAALVTLFHELGHAVAGWLLGYPSIPAFDFVYGGGMTHHGEFRLPVAIAVGAGFAWVGWLFRENRKSLALVAVVAGVWLLFVTREWRREIVFASAGHAAEVILAAILFYRALAGVGWRIPEIERPLAAFAAFFVQIHSMTFAWRLTHDPAYLDWYRGGKGGALMNDLEVVALDLQIWLGIELGIEGAARVLLVFSVLPILVALVWFFERARWYRLLRTFRTADSA